jgi:hypothetical protein
MAGRRLTLANVKVTMKSSVLVLLILTNGVALTGGCTAEASEPLQIARQLPLSPGHRIMPHRIIRASNGDLIVLGSTDNVMDYRAWATRVARSGEVRWDFLEGGPDGWNDRSVSGQRFYGAIEMPDQTTLLCGIKVIRNTNTIMLVTLDKDGSLVSEKLLPPVRDNVVVSIGGCYKSTDGIILIGTVSGSPRGTGWMAKLDWELNLQSKRFSDDLVRDEELIDLGGTLITLSSHGPQSFVVNIGRDGDIIAKQLLPDGEHHLVQGNRTDPPVRIAMMLPAFKRSEILDFDEQLKGPKRTLKLYNVGIKKALALTDGTIVTLGSQYTDSATAAVTRIYKDGAYKSFIVQPPHQSPWYIDAVLTGDGNEVAAVRQVGVEQAVMDFISFRQP